MAAVVIAAVASMATANADSGSQAEYQFWENAKLAGRALACGDKAGKASIRSASRALSGVLSHETQSPAQLMDAFDEKVRLHRRFAERASATHRACDRNAKAIKEGLRRTRVIAPDDTLDF